MPCGYHISRAVSVSEEVAAGEFRVGRVEAAAGLRFAARFSALLTVQLLCLAQQS